MKRYSNAMGCVLLLLTLAVGVFADSDSAGTDAEKALLKADADWSRAAQAEQKDAFFENLTSDVVVLAPHQPMAIGVEQARAVFQGMFDLPGIQLSWQPVAAKIAESGEMAYTYGTYELSFEGADGKPVADKGKYMTVWKKQADGVWRAAVDMFNTDLPM